jgi:hypothetical protein
LLFVVSVLVGTCCTQEIQAHVGDRVYPIYEISDADLAKMRFHDGSIEDWEEIVGEPSLFLADFHSLPAHGDESAPAPYNDPSDLAFRIWLGWNRTSHLLLFAYEGFDNYYVNEYPGGEIYKVLDHDSISIMVDGDHSGGDYGPGDPNWADAERILNRGRTAQMVVAIAEAPDNRSVGYMGTTAGWVSVPPYVDGGGMATGESSAIVVIEFRMTPFDDLLWNSQDGSVPSDLFPAKIIGLDIDVMDHDTKPGDYHGMLSLSGEWIAMALADYFVDGILVGAGADVPAVVEGGTWGRIKASLR